MKIADREISGMRSIAIISSFVTPKKTQDTLSVIPRNHNDAISVIPKKTQDALSVIPKKRSD